MKGFNKRYQPNYNGFFSMVENIADELNDRKNRFDKSDLLEQCFEQITDGRIKWIDEEGCDHIDEKSGTKFEMKSQKFCLYTAKGNLKKKTTAIKLTNTLQNKEDRVLKATSDWLLVVDTGNENSYSVAIISYKDVVEKYAKKLKDGFECQIPISELVFLRIPSQVSVSIVKECKSYSEEKRRLQAEYIDTFLNKTEY